MDFLAIYSEAGMIGVVGAMFVFMVYSMNKRGNEQAEALCNSLRNSHEKQSIIDALSRLGTKTLKHKIKERIDIIINNLAFFISNPSLLFLLYCRQAI